MGAGLFRLQDLLCADACSTQINSSEEKITFIAI